MIKLKSETDWRGADKGPSTVSHWQGWWVYELQNRVRLEWKKNQKFMFDQRQKMPAEIRNFICTRTQSPQNKDKGFGTCRETKGRQLSSLPASCHPRVTCHSTSSPSPLLPKIGAALRMLFLQHIHHLPHQENPRLSLGRFSKEFFRWRKKAAKRSLRKVRLHHWPVLSNASPSGPDRLANFTNWSACHITGYLALFLLGHIT